MLSKTSLRNQAKKLYKKTLAGPGKFGIFILLCIIIIFSFESLGLTNKEKNLEVRIVNKKVIPIKVQEKRVKKVPSLEKENSNALNKKIKIVTEMDITKKLIERENILLSGAIEQNIYENNMTFENFEYISYKEKLVTLNDFIINKSLEEIKNNQNDFFFDA